MYVTVDVESGAVALEEPEVFTQFHVSASGHDVAAVAAALGEHGRAGEGDHVYVAITSVRAWAAGQVGEGWDEGFEKMLGYARSKGWLDDAGTHVQAHVEWG